jgi:hypothetical protein
MHKQKTALLTLSLALSTVACAGAGDGDGSLALEARGAADPSPTVSVVAIDRAVATSDGTDTVTVTVTARDAAGQPVKGWTVTLSATGSGIEVIQPSSITDANGTATGGLRSTTDGTKVITARLTKGRSSVTLSGQPSVTFKTLDSVTYGYVPNFISVGDQVQLQTYGRYTDGTLVELTGRTVWSSSNSQVATVSSTGLATAISVGTATIYGQVTGIPWQPTVSILFTVHLKLQALEIEPTDVSLFYGQTLQYDALAHYTDGSVVDVTQDDELVWSSLNTNIVQIENYTGAKGLATAWGIGATEIQARYGNLVATAHFTGHGTVHIDVTPANMFLGPGYVQQYTAMATLDTGVVLDVTRDPNTLWSSSDLSVATIANASDTKGQATAVYYGTTQITAQFQGVDGSTPLEVVVP